MGEYLVRHIDKCLGIVTTETLDYPDLDVVREDGCDQGDPFVCCEFPTDQTFPCWSTAALISTKGVTELPVNLRQSHVEVAE